MRCGALYAVAAYAMWGVLPVYLKSLRHIPLSLLGILQYVAPTLQFLLGVLRYREPFDQARLTGFLCIWSALAVYSADGLRQGRSGYGVR